MNDIVGTLFNEIPCGVGSKRNDLKLSTSELKKLLVNGAKWAVDKGLGTRADLDHIEDEGRIGGADASLISDHALERGLQQVGTLGAGNHFVEVGAVSEIFDNDLAETFGLSEGDVTVMVHTGSRGFGHQVCQDYLGEMMVASRKYGIELPDKQLSAAPIRSDEGRKYLASMACAANFAFANRQVISYWVGHALERDLHTAPKNIGMRLIYDVAHNIAKMEEHVVDGKKRKLLVHRKGATRSFPPNHPEIPDIYRDVGQPVIIPGDMGRCSYLLVGTERSMAETFGSTCHGAGRKMSRHAAKKAARGRIIETLT